MNNFNNNNFNMNNFNMDNFNMNNFNNNNFIPIYIIFNMLSTLVLFVSPIPIVLVIFIKFLECSSVEYVRKHYRNIDRELDREIDRELDREIDREIDRELDVLNGEFSKVIGIPVAKVSWTKHWNEIVEYDISTFTYYPHIITYAEHITLYSNLCYNSLIMFNEVPFLNEKTMIVNGYPL